MGRQDELLDFWFERISPKQWWYQDLNFDHGIKLRFSDLLEQAKKGELFHWRKDAAGSLAEILLLDQISRHIYRNKAQAYEADPIALVLAQRAIEMGFDQRLFGAKKQFLYMPFMHSESLKMQEYSCQLFKDPSIKGYQSAIKHYHIIQQFGRFPSRNKALGRENTPQETLFLARS